VTDVLLGGGSLEECDHPGKFKLMEKKSSITAKDLQEKIYSEKDPICIECKNKCIVE